MQRACATCAAFAPPEGDGDAGQCRASPPTVFMVTGKVPATNIQTAQQSARIAVDFIPAFPPVSVDGWCAAWRGKLHGGPGQPL
jgi:hypothetical protein